MHGYEVLQEVEDDLFQIWNAVAEHSVEAADKVEGKIRRNFEMLAFMPGQGHRRPDLSQRLLFWPVWSYLIAYRSEPLPILMVAVVLGKRSRRTLSLLLAGRS